MKLKTFIQKQQLKLVQIRVLSVKVEKLLALTRCTINARNIFLEKNSGTYTSYIDDYDTLGISVYDLLHNSETKTYFNKNNAAFKEAVRKVLFDNNFEVAVKPVVTRESTSYGKNTTLRIKNVNSDFSSGYKDAVGISDTPLVMSAGLWNNLFTFDEFGKYISERGHDVWLIELTGGPENDCVDCPNYNFNDLKDYYWTASVAGITEYSGKSQVNYLGFSNGCRVGLSALETHSDGENDVGYYFDYSTGQYLFSDLPATPVSTFIGMGCPGNFSGSSLFEECFAEYGQGVVDYFENQGIDHPTQRQIMIQLARESPFSSACNYLNALLRSEERISENLGQQYYNWIVNNPSTQPGANVNLDKYISLYGLNGFGRDNDDDYLVSEEDQLGILTSINSSIKRNYSMHLRHNELSNNDGFRNIIVEELK